MFPTGCEYLARNFSLSFLCFGLGLLFWRVLVVIARYKTSGNASRGSYGLVINFNILSSTWILLAVAAFGSNLDSVTRQPLAAGMFRHSFSNVGLHASLTIQIV